jgi:hypothetical protein
MPRPHHLKKWQILFFVSMILLLLFGSSEYEHHEFKWNRIEKGSLFQIHEIFYEFPVRCYFPLSGPERVVTPKQLHFDLMTFMCSSHPSANVKIINLVDLVDSKCKGAKFHIFPFFMI